MPLCPNNWPTVSALWCGMVKPTLTPPAFWRRKAGITAHLLRPFATLVAMVARRRRRQRGWVAPVPVLCVGNLTVGGTGKTTVVLDLARRLNARGERVHCLTRGYGGRLGRGGQPVRAEPARHDARDVGDEALLLAKVAPTWVCADRAAAAKAACAAGATCLLMDDGFQNPSLHRTLSLVLADGATGFGNGLPLPAGPLREGLDAGLAAADVVVITGEDRSGTAERLACHAPNKPVLSAGLIMDAPPEQARTRPVVAFAGLARPDKFFEGLRALDIQPVSCVPFPDHHVLTERERNCLLALARTHNALLLTTPKDAVRLPSAFRQKVEVIGVNLQWNAPRSVERLLDQLLNKEPS